MKQLEETEITWEEVEDTKHMKKEFTGYRYQAGLLRSTPGEWTMLPRTASLVPTYSNMVVRPSDVWVASYPKCGTTWTQEMVWQVANKVDMEGGKVDLSQRFPFLEWDSLLNTDTWYQIPGVWAKLSALFSQVSRWWSGVVWHIPSSWLGYNSFADKLSAEVETKQRFIKTHLPLSLLPPTLVDTAKVIYVARNPHDVMVSFFYHHKLIKGLGYVGDLSEFAKRFMDNQLMFGPFFPHIEEGWSLKDHPNFLFIFFEDMKYDMKSVIGKVSKFLDSPLSDTQVETLIDHLDIKNFRNNPAVNHESFKSMGLFEKEGNFIRKGEVGGWREEFQKFPKLEEMFNTWVKESMVTSTVVFPGIEKKSVETTLSTSVDCTLRQ